MAGEKGEISLGEIREKTTENSADREILIPTVEIFKEIMVELIRNREIDIGALQKERSEYIQDKPMEFQLNEMLLHLIEDFPENSGIIKIETHRLEDSGAVVFEGVMDERGEQKNIKCSNVIIRVEKVSYYSRYSKHHAKKYFPNFGKNIQNWKRRENRDGI